MPKLLKCTKSISGSFREMSQRITHLSLEEQGLSPSVPLAICLCSAFQFLLSGPLFLFLSSSLVSQSQKCLGLHVIQIVARVTMFIINSPFNDFKVVSNLISISHSYNALCYTICSCEVGKTGIFWR